MPTQFNRHSVILLALTLCLLPGQSPVGAEFGPEAKKEFSIKRKEVFEFTQKPVVSGQGDRWEIRFTSKDYCDVTVVIENSKGRILRHLVSGIMGPKAPAPLKPNSLEQYMVWDGKDDRGKYIDDKADCFVRVSLGLKARFERNLYQHPFRTLGNDTAIAIDKDGVYVYENNLCDYIRKYDHNGDYAEMIYPFARHKLKDIKELPMRSVPPDGEMIPDKKNGFGENLRTVTLLPLETVLYKCGSFYMGAMVAHGGMLNLLGKRLVRVGTDGTTRGLPLSSIQDCRVELGKKGKCLPYSAAVSPDGKWLYMTRILGGGNGVYRMRLDRPQNPKLFIGTPEKGKPDGMFDGSSSVAVDPKGRIYVTDWENDRIQVFSSEGKFLRKFKVLGPTEIQVDPTSGEIWVFSWQLRTRFVHSNTRAADEAYCNRVKPSMLRVFAPLDSAAQGAPKLKVETLLDVAQLEQYKTNKKLAFQIRLVGGLVRASVDFWSNPKRVWMVTGRRRFQDSIHVLNLKDGKLTLHRNYDEEVRRAGYCQHVGGFQRQFLAFDSLNEHLYLGEANTGKGKVFSNVVRMDVNTGDHKLIRLPACAPDMTIDQNGLAYLRLNQVFTRFKLPEWREVPYDYGEEGLFYGGTATRGVRAIAALRTPGGQGGSDRYNAIGVSPLGDVIATCSYRMPNAGKDKSRRRNTKDTTKRTVRWKPQIYAGRPGGGVYVHIFDKYGTIKHKDVLKGVGLLTGGIDTDLEGNIYAVVRAGRILDGRRFGMWPNGTLMKFKPGQGRFLTDRKPMVPLDEKPEGRKTSTLGWAQGAEWAYGWASAGSTNHCWCRHGQFKVDYFGRSFVPESDRYSVAVLDTSGQLIMRIGRCGNVDDGKPLIPSKNGAVHRSIGGDEVALFDAHYVNTQTDKRLFIGDMGNGRVLSVKLDYHVSERLPLK